MHQLNVAHRYVMRPYLRLIKPHCPESDCTSENVALSRSKTRPNERLSGLNDRNFVGAVQAYTRMRRPPRYYLVGFELSVLYSSRDIVDETWRRGDTFAPEHRSRGCSNPFHTDIYYLGHLVSQEFVEASSYFSGSSEMITIFVHRNVMASSLWRIWSPR